MCEREREKWEIEKESEVGRESKREGWGERQSNKNSKR